jgi:hypothetical protein
MKVQALTVARRAAAWFRAHWHDLLFLLLALGVFFWVTNDAFTSRVVTTSQTSDYWEHSAALRALLDSPWHPHNPQLVSPASGPRFIPTFVISALLGRAFALDALGAMGVASCLHLLLLLSGIFWFFRLYFRDARASLYGLVVMLTSWWDAWHYSNVYQLKILFSVVAYPSTAALGLSLLGFALTIRALRGGARWASLAAVALIWAIVVVTHPLTAALGLSGAMLLTIDQPGLPLALRARVAGAILLGGALSLLWPYFSVKGVVMTGGHNEVEAAVSAGGEASGRMHAFYRQDGLMKSLGLALAGVPIALYLAVRRRHWFIPLGALAMLLPFVVNAYRPVPLGHRFILLAAFYLQVALVWFLLKLTRGAPEAWPALTRGRRGWLSGALVASILLASAWWNMRAADAQLSLLRRRLHGGESINVHYARQAAELAGKDSVIMADVKASWPLPTFGPKIVALLHPNPLVSDEDVRDRDVAEFVRGSGGDAHALEILKRYGVTHVLTNRTSRRRLDSLLARYAEGARPLPGGYALYRLRALD